MEVWEQNAALPSAGWDGEGGGEALPPRAFSSVDWVCPVAGEQAVSPGSPGLSSSPLHPTGLGQGQGQEASFGEALAFFAFLLEGPPT